MRKFGSILFCRCYATEVFFTEVVLLEHSYVVICYSNQLMNRLLVWYPIHTTYCSKYSE